MARFSRLHFVALAVVLVAVAASMGYWWRLTAGQDRLREATVTQMGQRAAQLADAVAGQTAILVHLVDFAVQHLRDDYIDDDHRPFEATVKSVLEAFPPGAVLQVGVIDADGYLSYSSLGVRDRVYLGDRLHFKVHTGDGAKDHLFIAKPVFGRVSNTWSIQFTRPIRRNGKFVGVLVLSLAPEYVARSLALADLSADDVIALFLQDGTYLSRNRDLANALGKSTPADRPFIGDQAPMQGTFRVAAAFDKIHRTYAWRRLESFPLVVNVGIGEAAILSPVEAAIDQERQRSGIAVGIALLLAGGFSLLLSGVAVRQQALTQSENRYRAFFETNTAVKLLIEPADGRIVDANEAAAAFYGYSRENLLQMRISDINCLPAEQVKAEMALAQAEQRLYFNFPHRLASGEVRQVEVYSGPVEIGGRRLLFSIIHDTTVRYELARKLSESEELHRVLFETMAEGVVVVEADGRIVAWNDAALAIIGVDAEGLKAQRITLVDGQRRPLSINDFPSVRSARGEELEHALFGIVRGDGELVWVTVSSRSLRRDGSSGPGAAVVSFSDITRLVAAEESLKLAQSVFEAAMEGVIVTDAGNRIVAVNPAFAEITGFTAAESIGQRPSILASGQHDAAFYQAMWQRLTTTGRWEGEVVNRRKDGGTYVEWLKISVVADSQGQPYRYVGLFSDVTEKKRKEAMVWHQANFDELTGLPNRKLLEDRLSRAIAQARRRHTQLALLFIDLDRFKPVNDEFGHAVGDDLLRQVGKRLQYALREEDTVARLGGDEFVAVLPDLQVASVPARMAEKMVAVLSEPFRVGEHILEISCSVGIAIFPRDADTPEELIERADTAMYAAKAAGRSSWRSV